ncbi:hypothetical protein AGOR_G00043860 [Albula goreensis]|uniref:Ig-like domain-containing protein n=1 Tax=Albula goreensis TaxID=1534307 RepID=A0A8T3E114_9TELE|nr:hypothetical protein AGOR_G00043860 [Albula goreensis]
MWLLIGMSVLLCENAGSDNTVRVVKVKENGTASLPCGTSTPTCPVTWSRDKGKEKILSLLDDKDQDIKYINDTRRRYGTAADFNLTITRVSRSDSGIYYCNGNPVQLQVMTKTEADLGQETTKAGILKKPGTAAGTASEKGEGRGDKMKRQQTKTENQNKDDKHRKGGQGQGSGQNDRRKESQRTQKSAGSLTVVTTAATTTSTEGTQGEGKDKTTGSSSVQTGWKVLGMFLATLPFITATAAAVWAHGVGSAVGISQ